MPCRQSTATMTLHRGERRRKTTATRFSTGSRNLGV
jgi:hypothetical protein